jgi:(methylthio)acryloyl-CoA hydratase
MQSLVRRKLEGRVAVISLNRPEKRNAFSAALFGELRDAFASLPTDVRAVVLSGEGEHFCSGLDLSEHKIAEPFPSVLYSREGHRIFDGIKNCGRPVITAMHGAVIGGGLELACCTHIRVAETGTFYALPEGRRGIFLGGGGTVHVRRIIGAGRLTEIMLTARRVTADEGQQLGLSHYVVESGKALGKAMELAERVATNAPISNYLMLTAVDMIDTMPPEAGLFTEAVAQALTLTTEDARAGIDAFLQKRDVTF